MVSVRPRKVLLPRPRDEVATTYPTRTIKGQEIIGSESCGGSNICKVREVDCVKGDGWVTC